MTALNALVTADAAHLFTDGGLFDHANGAMAGVGNKVQLFPHLNAAIASNGWATIGYMLWDALTEPGFKTFDDLAAGYGDAVKRYAGKASYWPAGAFEAALVGWSENADAPQAWIVSNIATSVSPFVARKVNKSLTPFDLSVRAVEHNGDDEAYGLAVMEKQRAGLWDTMGRQGVKAVGGFAQHTRIDRDGISIKVLRRWDD